MTDGKSMLLKVTGVSILHPHIKRICKTINLTFIMKKLSFVIPACLFIALLLTSGNSYSQSRLIFSPGIAVGKSMTNKSPEITELYSIKNLPGFDGGIGYEFELTPKFSLQTELNYSLQGAQLAVKPTDLSTVGFLTFRLNYLTIPAFAKLYLKKGFSIFAGPQFGYLVSARIHAYGSNAQTRGDVSAFFRKTDIYAVGGIEYRFPAGLFINARYNYGLQNPSDSLWAKISFPEGKVRNKYLSFRVGYSIPFSKLMKSRD